MLGMELYMFAVKTAEMLISVRGINFISKLACLRRRKLDTYHCIKYDLLPIGTEFVYGIQLLPSA